MGQDFLEEFLEDEGSPLLGRGGPLVGKVAGGDLSSSDEEEEERPRRELEEVEEEDVEKGKAEEGAEEEEIVETWHSWLVVLASFGVICVLDGSMYSNAVFTESLVKDLGAGSSAVAAGASLQVAASATVAPLAATLTNRLGPRTVCLLGSLTAAAGWLVASCAGGLPALLVGHSILGGVGFGLMYLPAVVAAAGVFGPRRSLALAIVVSGSGAGQVLLGPTIGELLQILGWRGAFRAVAGICVGCAGLGLLMPTPRLAPARPATAPALGKASPWATRLLGAGVAGQTMVPVFLLFGAGDALAVMALYIPYSVLPGLAIGADISPALASLLIAALGVGSVAGRLAAGWLCDRPWCHPLALTRLALTLATPFPLLLAITPPSFPLLSCLCCALGLLTGAWISATSPLLVSLLGVPHLGTAFGRLTAVRGVAALASPPLAAMLASALALPTLPLTISAGLFALSALVQSVAVTVFNGRQKRTLYEQLS